MFPTDYRPQYKYFAWLDRIKYKDGWEFSIQPGPVLTASTRVRDSTGTVSEKLTYISRMDIPLSVDTEEKFRRLVFAVVAHAEIHEAAEWFKDKETDKAIFNPHVNGDKDAKAVVELLAGELVWKVA
jgi:hypothetical protein